MPWCTPGTADAALNPGAQKMKTNLEYVHENCDTFAGFNPMTELTYGGIECETGRGVGGCEGLEGEGDGGVRGGGSAGHHQLRPLKITVEPDELVTSAQLPGLCNNKSKDLFSNVHCTCRVISKKLPPANTIVLYCLPRTKRKVWWEVVAAVQV